MLSSVIFPVSAGLSVQNEYLVTSTVYMVLFVIKATNYDNVKIIILNVLTKLFVTKRTTNAATTILTVTIHF